MFYLNACFIAASLLFPYLAFAEGPGISMRVGKISIQPEKLANLPEWKQSTGTSIVVQGTYDVLLFPAFFLYGMMGVHHSSTDQTLSNQIFAKQGDTLGPITAPADVTGDVVQESSGFSLPLELGVRYDIFEKAGVEFGGGVDQGLSGKGSVRLIGKRPKDFATFVSQTLEFEVTSGRNFYFGGRAFYRMNERVSIGLEAQTIQAGKQTQKNKNDAAGQKKGDSLTFKYSGYALRVGGSFTF